jgi:hypothetical protein
MVVSGSYSPTFSVSDPRRVSINTYPDTDPNMDPAHSHILEPGKLEGQFIHKNQIRIMECMLLFEVNSLENYFKIDLGFYGYGNLRICVKMPNLLFVYSSSWQT